MQDKAKDAMTSNGLENMKTGNPQGPVIFNFDNFDYFTESQEGKQEARLEGDCLEAAEASKLRHVDPYGHCA